MTRPTAIFYPNRADPLFGQLVETITLDKWWQPERRSAEKQKYYYRAWLNDLATFADLFAPIEAVTVAMWWSESVRPAARARGQNTAHLGGGPLFIPQPMRLHVITPKRIRKRTLPRYKRG